MLETIWQDVRHTARSWRRAPAFTCAAVLTLGLGIGANTVMFSLSDATAFRPPDVPRPLEIVRVFSSTRDVPYGELSYPDYVDFRDGTTALAGLVAYEHADFALATTRSDPARYIGGWAVSANFFSVVGVEPARGRGFREDDERTAAQVAVISHQLWDREFQRDPSILGTHVVLSGHEFTVIGVAPERFRGTELYFHPEIYVPLPTLPVLSAAFSPNVLENRSQRWLTVVGRLARGHTAGQAGSELGVIARALEQTYPDANRGRTTLVLPEREARARLDDGGWNGAIVMMVLVGLVLLLASTNVAHLMLSRAAGRTHEMAVRLAVGASRARVVRQLLTESLMLAFAGGGLGLLIAFWTVAYVNGVLAIPTDLPLAVDIRMDERVLLFTLSTTTLTGVLFGMTPALQSSRLSLSRWLGRTEEVRTHRSRFMLNAVVVSQVTASVVVLIAAGLLVRASFTAQQIDPGFQRDRVLLVSFNPGLVGYDGPRARRFYHEIVERTQALPEVASAGLTRYVPLGVTHGSVSVVVDGFEMPQGQDRLSVEETIVDAGYWQVLRVPIIRGRPFDARDTESSPPVVVVNEAMAGRYWPSEDPIGKTVRFPDRGQFTRSAQVVGIAKDGKYVSLAEAPQPFVYRPFAQSPRLRMTMVVLARGEAAALAPAVRAQAAAIDSNVPMFDVRPLDDLYRSRALGPPRSVSLIVTTLGVLALLLAAVGLYGVIAFLTARRTHEIGIRMAVGAAPRRVMRLVLGQAGVLVGTGLLLGLGMAVLLAPQLGSPAFDFVVPRDGAVFTLVPLLIGVVALLAAAIPAVRAMRIDPVAALRAD